MAQSFYPTAQQVIDAALLVCGAIDPESGVTPTTQQRTDALQALNFLVTSWQAHGMQVWCQKETSHALTASTVSYTMGPSGDMNIARPLTVSMVRLRDTVSSPNSDRVLLPISREEYNAISSKTSTGTPNCYYYDPQYDLPGSNSGSSAKGKLYIWPAPTDADVTQYDLYIIYTRPIQDFSTTSDNLDFPQEWFNAVKWNLAVMIAPEYEVPIMKQNRIEKIAKDALDLAMSWDRNQHSTSISPEQE